MSYFVLLSNFNLFGKQHNSLDNMIKNSLYNWRRWFLWSFVWLILFNNLAINYYFFVIDIMIFLDTWVIVLSVYEYLYCSPSSLFHLCIIWDFEENKFNFVFKIIYLFVHYSHVALDYDSIYIILPCIFSKIFVYFFFPLEWYFFKK